MPAIPRSLVLNTQKFCTAFHRSTLWAAAVAPITAMLNASVLRLRLQANNRRGGNGGNDLDVDR